MSQLSAITVTGLGKQYRIPTKKEAPTTLREAVSAALRRGPRGRRFEDFWAVRDVSFSASPGEAIAIIGRNGSGKSTLLKMLSRITAPTTGSIRIRGRVESLLEVGTGFHPELTGRENIFLNGAILGMKRREIQRKFEQIVAFSEAERFLDTQVKHYSSGMHVRLAFAVASHLDPDILIVDEVLAVGDAGFQKKCLARMEEVWKEEGRTVLFVSHNVSAVKTLCTRGLVMEKGAIIMDAPVDAAVDHYIESVAARASEQRWDLTRAPGDERARLSQVRLLDAEGASAAQIAIDTDLYVEVEYVVLSEGVKLSVSLELFFGFDVHVLSCPSVSDPNWYQEAHPRGRYRARCHIPKGLLNNGHYSFNVLLVADAGEVIAREKRAVSFDALDVRAAHPRRGNPWLGAIRPTLDWCTERISDGLEEARRAGG